ncbi:hypothetical protein [Aeoliella mucimassa]|uniref:Uncharacterized protein n=1 Tax=Aeoliella mucimassa TaxID=2527972 RepID=A0A518ASI0_9BACT|nr:hypothetical protein [Aeoliella mucimassa]QDU57668.1 hypothetical protein Pan181_38880 [Aeoliella mucimassa]
MHDSTPRQSTELLIGNEPRRTTRLHVAVSIMGAVLVSLLLVNLVAYASPETASQLSGNSKASNYRCTTGGCCSSFTPVGMPESCFLDPATAPPARPVDDTAPAQ